MHKIMIGIEMWESISYGDVCCKPNAFTVMRARMAFPILHLTCPPRCDTTLRIQVNLLFPSLFHISCIYIVSVLLFVCRKVVSVKPFTHPSDRLTLRALWVASRYNSANR